MCWVETYDDQLEIIAGERIKRESFGLAGELCTCSGIFRCGFRAEQWPLCVTATAIYSVFRPNIGNTPSISRRSVLEALLCFIYIGYHWVSSDLSRKAEKRSNCEIGSNIMHELGGDGRDGDIFHCSNQQMTQQTAPKCWGMIVE